MLVSRIALLIVCSGALATSAAAQPDSPIRRTTDLVATVEGGIASHIFQTRSESDAAETKDVLGARLGLGLCQLELRRWMGSQWAWRFGLALGAGWSKVHVTRRRTRFDFDGTTTRTKEELATRVGPAGVFGLSVGGVVSAGRLLSFSGAGQWLYTRPRDVPGTLEGYELPGRGFSSFGLEARVAFRLPRGVEVGVAGRGAKVVRGEWFGSLSLVLAFRVFRPDPIGAVGPPGSDFTEER